SVAAIRASSDRRAVERPATTATTSTAVDRRTDRATITRAHTERGSRRRAYRRPVTSSDLRRCGAARGSRLQERAGDGPAAVQHEGRNAKERDVVEDLARPQDEVGVLPALDRADGGDAQQLGGGGRG